MLLLLLLLNRRSAVDLHCGWICGRLIRVIGLEWWLVISFEINIEVRLAKLLLRSKWNLSAWWLVRWITVEFEIVICWLTRLRLLIDCRDVECLLWILSESGKSWSLWVRVKFWLLLQIGRTKATWSPLRLVLLGLRLIKSELNSWFQLQIIYIWIDVLIFRKGNSVALL